MKKRLIIIIIAISGFVAVQVQAQSVTDDLLGRINGLRAELGLSPYSLNGALSAAANSQAQWMVNTSQVSHVQENGSTPRSRANANGYNSQWVSENIYMGGLANVDSAWNFWINSSIHYAGLTSPNYQDIGIGTAQGNGGQAYVLVFGVPPGSTWGGNTTSGNNSSTGNSGNSSGGSVTQPLAIVGYDEVGNIQYELQAGDTPGQVLLLFGYTWDDLDSWLELNSFTEADIRNLSIGQVVLVAPPQGTYTPTPIVEATAEVTEAVSEATEESVNNPTATATLIETQPSGVIPTPLPESLEATAIPVIPTEAPIEAVGQPVTFVAITASPTITQTASPMPTLQVNLPVSTTIAQTETPTEIVEDTTPGNSSRPPMWLIGAIVVQIGILIFASVQYFMQSRG